MTTLLEIDQAFDTIEDRLLADLRAAKERAKLLGEIPHTVSLTTYFNNQVIGSDSRQMTIKDDPESDDPYIDRDLIGAINQVIDSRLARRLYYFQPDNEDLVTWGMLGDIRHSIEQWVIYSHVQPMSRAIQDIDRQYAELRQQVKGMRQLLLWVAQ